MNKDFKKLKKTFMVSELCSHGTTRVFQEAGERINYVQWRQSWGLGGHDPQILKWGVVEGDRGGGLGGGRGGCGFRSFTQ
jgi:hypothetical protein